MEQVALDSGEVLAGDWEYLSDRPWRSASTGWVAMANDNLPSLDAAFNGGQLIVGGTVYSKGIGVYPLSEISYTLDGKFTLFDAEIGLNDLPGGTEDEGSRVVFSVYLDGALAYDSGVVSRGQLPVQVQLPLAGVNDLRLVASAAGVPSTQNYADWAAARLLKPRQAGDATAAEEDLGRLREQVAERARLRDEDRRAVGDLARLELAAISSAADSPGGLSTVIAAVERGRDVVTLRNEVVALSYGVGGAQHGLLTVMHVPSGQLLVYQADASVSIGDRHISLHFDTQPLGANAYELSDVTDPVLGSGRRLSAPLLAKAGDVRINFALTLYDHQPYFVQQISTEGVSVAGSAEWISHFESLGPANLGIGEGLNYLTDITRLRSATVPDDGIQRRETMDQGKPLYLSGSASGLGLLIAPLDETIGAPEMALQVDGGRLLGRLGLKTGMMRTARTTQTEAGPRLYVEAVPADKPKDAFANFRRVFSRLYPPAPLPDWVRYQWLSWYTYYTDINEQRIKQQIDYIAQNLSDLGPWHIIMDAGWYVAEGRPGADWRNVDRAKFPSGLRALVDYAHQRGVRVVLYFSAPYLDSRAVQGDWLGLRGLIDNHPDWLIPIGEDANHESLVYDLGNPALRGYLSDVMKDYFVSYDVDGIKIDGLGNAEGAVLSKGERDEFGLVGRVREPALDIYRLVATEAMTLKPDVYIESGWLDPLFADTLAHTFRYGDEGMAFSNRYPQPGLVEHVEYAVVQQALFGQRANMGAVYADPGQWTINEQWLAASVALGAQSSISFDLTKLSNELLSRYRSLLVPYRPFAGTSYYPDIPGVTAFGTLQDGTAYVGVLNSADDVRDVTLPLASFGLSGGSRYLLYDVQSDSFALTQSEIKVKLGARSFRLFVLRDQTGVLWTNSSFTTENAGNLFIVRGPAQIEGFARLLAPGLKGVLLDGNPMRAGNGSNSYTYDAQLGLLSMRYDHSRPHRLEIVR